ncbi:MAG: hypothetical protein OXH51_06265 [Gemmatimonadetes bacterium]|nr:hypothetical protein [Gemmatimonadota bacterium]
MDLVKTTLSGLTLSDPMNHGGLTVFPLTSDRSSPLSYLLLEDGLRKELVTIREVSEGGSVPELTVENRADKPVLIVDGEELVGAKQNRVANLTMLLAARKTTVIPVSCVEAGRWSYSKRDFGVTDRVQNARGRAEKVASVRHSLRSRGSRHSDQGQVWASIAEEAERLDAPSSTEAMSAMFDRHREKLDDYVAGVEAGVEAGDDQVGAVFVVRGRRYGLDLFDRPGTFAAFLPKLVRSYAIDAVGRERGGSRVSAADAGAFLDRIVAGAFDEHPGVGLGRDVGVVGEGLVAGGLVADETVVHLAAFAESARERSRQPADGAAGRPHASYRRRRDTLRQRFPAG